MNVATFLLVVNIIAPSIMIFMVHSIFKCLVEKNSYSKTIIFTKIFIIIHLLSISNKDLTLLSESLEKPLKKLLQFMLTHCDLQIWFQYQENDFRLIRLAFNFESLLQFFGFFNGLKSHKGKMAPKWNTTSLFILN